jgi:hypothetical protein
VRFGKFWTRQETLRLYADLHRRLVWLGSLLVSIAGVVSMALAALPMDPASDDAQHQIMKSAKRWL